MSDPTLGQAWIGLIGVGIGSLVTLVASVLVPWHRDVLDRRRIERERLKIELRDALLHALAELLAYRQALGARSDIGAALARFGAARNELIVRLSPAEQPVADVLLAMVAMVQEPSSDVANMVGESMEILTLWARGDVATEDVIGRVELAARVKFSEDRKSVTKA